MRNRTTAERRVAIRPGFSPKPITQITPMMATSPSPSLEPATPSPNALLDAPVIQRAAVREQGVEPTTENGIVSFGK